MRNTRARTCWWVIGAFALGMATVGTARADMIYFKNGTSMWGEEAEAEGDQIVLTRGGRTLKFPMADVERVEKKRTNMPAYKLDVPPIQAFPSPPGGGPAPGAPAPGVPAGPPPAISPSGPGSPQGAIPIPGAGPASPPPYVPPTAGPPSGSPTGGPPAGPPPALQQR